jgi:hypothetical protein
MASALRVCMENSCHTFGDSIFPRLPHIFSMYNNAASGSPQHALNSEMASVRVGIEWGFNLITNRFQSVDFIRWQRLFSTNIYRYSRIEWPLYLLTVSTVCEDQPSLAFFSPGLLWKIIWLGIGESMSSS